MWESWSAGDELFRDIRRIGFEYRGVKFCVDMLGWHPKSSDEVYGKELR